VAPGESVRLEKLDGAVGDTVELSEVLLVGDEGDPRVGTPLVAGAKVVGTILAQGRGPKVVVRKQGHRQAYTEVRVERIEG
jgi:large subunit ribosomal protein L21